MMSMTEQQIPKKQTIALIVEYDGSAFHGWQIQKKPAVDTVQYQVEKALSKIAHQPIKVFCAGRTDAGVHASAQVIHFETSAQRDLRAWREGANTYLPDTVAIRWAGFVDGDFHARFSAQQRTYRYIILNQAIRSPTLSKKVTLVKKTLDVHAMQEAANYLLGELDFSAYRAAACQSNTPFRCMYSLTVYRYGDFVITELTANAFLLHMVRNIMGVLIAIGSGEKRPQWAKEVLESRDRCQAGLTAKPYGLYLVKVTYPEHYGLPDLKPGPVFLPAWQDNSQQSR